MSSRDEILQRVRAGIGLGDAAGRRAAAEAWMAGRRCGPQPFLGGDLLGRFVARAESLSSSVERIAGRRSLPASVAGFLAAGQLGSAAVIAPELADLDWAASGLSVAARPAVDRDTVGITGCFCAIAETGTLLLLSGAQTPASVSLLPETHIALVDERRIVGTMEDAFALLRAEHGSLPRALNFVSGPSRTGDIEQTIVLGAHGPRRVHLILAAA
ncbi:MAG: lactate utilization protein C [Dechloromonas sp.]|nr:MAG: lactate utilization protein C [Dechloromonas sp.]